MKARSICFSLYSFVLELLEVELVPNIKETRLGSTIESFSSSQCHDFIAKGNTRGATAAENEDRERAVAVWPSPAEIYRGRTPMH